MVACKYRWLAALFLPIDIKKHLLMILCLRNFRLTKKNKHTYNLPGPSNQPAGTFIFKLCGIIEVSTSYTEQLSSCAINILTGGGTGQTILLHHK